MLGAFHPAKPKDYFFVGINPDTGHFVNPERSDNSKLKQADLPCRAKKKRTAMVYRIQLY